MFKPVLAKVIISGAIFLAATIFFISFDLFKNAEAQGSGDGMQQGPMPVSVELIGSQDVRIWKDFPGRLVAVDQAEIRPQVSGRITELRFQDGARVEKGDVLFVIDPRPYEATLAQAKAALQAAQSSFSRANKDFKRAEELIKTNAISKSIYDERRAQKDFAWAEIKGAKAAIQQADINLDYAHVKAPISGRASRAEITLGNVVESGPNAPLLTTIVADELVYVDFEVDEQTYLSQVRQQALSTKEESKIPVQIVLRGDDRPIDGFIHAFDNRINPASGIIRARAILENKDGALLPGMFARVRLGSASSTKQILIGEKAVGIDQDRRFAYVVNDENVVEYRQIEIGERVNSSRVVLSGLSEGEQVIAQGILMIRPGMQVQPMPQEGAANKEQGPVDQPSIAPAIDTKASKPEPEEPAEQPSAQQAPAEAPRESP